MSLSSPHMCFQCSPREADAFVRSQRPQISERWYTEPVQRAAALAKARLAGEADQ
jgi:hypothetical protein